MKIKKRIKDLNILVIGDIMLDKYVIGNVDRISPEAPVGVVCVKNEYSTLGGSGNVISNLASLGVKVSCISRVGVDEAGIEIANKLDELKVSHYLAIDDIPTIQKERVISNNYQMIRIDREKIKLCKDIVLDKILIALKKEIEKEPDIIIVSDYAKGIITEEIMNVLSKVSIKIIVDPKPINVHLYKNVYMLTPNNDEYFKMIDPLHGPEAEEVCEYVLHTKGKDGMVLYDNKVLSPFMNGTEISSTPVKVFNVSGAGDTVIAIMAICISLDINPLTSAKIANKCSEFVVMLPGTNVVPIKKFNEIYNFYYKE